MDEDLSFEEAEIEDSSILSTEYEVQTRGRGEDEWDQGDIYTSIETAQEAADGYDPYKCSVRIIEITKREL